MLRFETLKFSFKETMFFRVLWIFCNFVYILTCRGWNCCYSLNWCNRSRYWWLGNNWWYLKLNYLGLHVHLWSNELLLWLKHRLHHLRRLNLLWHHHLWWKLLHLSGHLHWHIFAVYLLKSLNLLTLIG